MILAVFFHFPNFSKYSAAQSRGFVFRGPFRYIVQNEVDGCMTEVAVGIIIRDRSLLMGQRKKGGRYELLWEFPGGKLERGESVEACLRRELKEELSIDAHDIRQIETQSAYYKDGGIFEVHYCSVGSFSLEPQNNVFESIAWIPLADVRTLKVLEGNVPFIESFLRQYEKSHPQ
jgi:8-oxo-dGTP diphosphatase